MILFIRSHLSLSANIELLGKNAFLTPVWLGSPHKLEESGRRMRGPLNSVGLTVHRPPAGRFTELLSSFYLIRRNADRSAGWWEYEQLRFFSDNKLHFLDNKYIKVGKKDKYTIKIEFFPKELIHSLEIVTEDWKDLVPPHPSRTLTNKIKMQ